jgi:hypothetical protein
VHINLSKKIITWKIYSQTAIVDLPIKTSNHLFSLNKSSKEKTVTGFIGGGNKEYLEKTTDLPNFIT